MKLSSQVVSLAGRFDRLSLRERMLVLAAMIAAVIAAFNVLLMAPLDTRRTRLLAELAEVGSGMTLAATAASEVATDPASAAYARASELKVRLESVDAQLTAQSAGMIPSKRMAEVIHDVLSAQHGVVLVSLRSLPAVKLSPDAPGQISSGTRAPYVHTVELVLEGGYLEVLTYLQALEALPWRFYWRHLDLTTTHYPINRVRVEVGTVNMDSEWLDL